MAKVSAGIAPRPWRGAPRLSWALPWLCACSVYDTSLLSGDGDAGSAGTGLATSGGRATTTGGKGNTTKGGSGNTLGGTTGGSDDESGGTSAGGAATGGKGSTAQGGGPSSGGVTATGGALTSSGAPGTGGATGAGGTLGSGGVRTGGAPATGGAASGGKGGTPSTGGKGGTPTGGTSTGGTSTGGTSTGGTSTGGSVTATGGSDGCPTDPNKTVPGVCGCGIPDQDSGTSAGCVGLRSALVHRYRFTGIGAAVSDSVGTAHGTVVNAALTNTGSLTLSGTTTDQFVDLPNDIVSSLTNATIEAWLTWGGGASWQRIFDFGDAAGGVEGTQDTGQSYLFLTPKAPGAGLRVTFTVNGTANETVLNTSAALASGTVSHVSVVVDDTNDLLALYLNGAVIGSVAFSGQLAGINDVNNWLGRSQFVSDPEFAGVLHELRIYGAALSAQQIQLTEQTGPDPAFF